MIDESRIVTTTTATLLAATLLAATLNCNYKLTGNTAKSGHRNLITDLQDTVYCNTARARNNTKIS